MTAIAILHREEILTKLASGMILREIAAEYGITKQAISQVLQHDPDYAIALQHQADSMIQEAKVETWAAREPLDIARAREMTKFAFRYAESIDSERWSPKSNIKIEHIGDRADQLRAAKSRLIDGELSTDTQPQKQLNPPK